MVAGLCVCEWGDDYSGCYVIGEKFYVKFDVTIFDVTVFDVPVFDVNSSSRIVGQSLTLN